MLLRRLFFSLTALVILLCFPSLTHAQEDDKCGFTIETNPPPNSVTVDPGVNSGHHVSMENLVITSPNATFSVRAPTDKDDVYLYVKRGNYDSETVLAEHRFDTRNGPRQFVFSEFYPYVNLNDGSISDSYYTIEVIDDRSSGPLGQIDYKICSAQLRINIPNSEVAICCPPGSTEFFRVEDKCKLESGQLVDTAICSLDDEGNWQYGYSHFVNLCKQANPDTESHTYLQCIECQNNSRGVWTAIGCIPATAEGITSSIVRFLVAIAGGVALLFLLIGAFTITTSSSDPQRLQQGREVITSAIVGLILVVLSLSILQFIGVDILQLPGF